MRLTEEIEKLGKGVNGTTKTVEAPKKIEVFEMSLDYQPKNDCIALHSQNSPLVYRGEMFVPVGLPGHGKTSLLEGAAAAQIVAKNNLTGIDTLGYIAHSLGKKVLFIDTERPGDNCHKSYTQLFKRLKKNPELLTPEGNKFKDLDYLVLAEVGEADKLRKILKQYLSTGLYELVIIDGVLDLCLSLLDDKDSAKVIKELRALAVKYDCVIVTTIHPNKGTMNPAGHPGAFLYRYSRAMLGVRNTSDKNIKELTADFESAKLSHGSIGDFEPVYFTWDQEQGMMISCGPPSPPAYKINFLKQAIIELRLQGQNEIPSAMLKAHYGKLAGVKDATAKKHLIKAVEDGLLHTVGEGKATRYLPSSDWNISASHSDTNALYIDRSAYPNGEIDRGKSPNENRIAEDEYPKEWDLSPNENRKD